MRGVSCRENIGLLGAGGHAGRGAGALYIHQHRGYLGEVGEAQKFTHQ